MKKSQIRRCRRGGFTLIEVLLVLAILGVIAAMVVPNLLGRQRDAYIKATRESIQSVEHAADLFATDHDAEYPQSLQQLMQPEIINGIQKEAYLPKPPLDAWKNLIIYTPPQQVGQKPFIVSYGPNRQEGGGDDISNMDDQYNQQQL
jgi:general secretion pathway protein G